MKNKKVKKISQTKRFCPYESQEENQEDPNKIQEIKKLKNKRCQKYKEDEGEKERPRIRIKKNSQI